MNVPVITPSDIGGFFAILSRLGAFFMAFPFINSGMVPLNVRIFLLLSLSFFVSSILHIKIPIDAYSLLDIALMVGKEFLIGLSMALLTAIFLGIVSYAAELISYSMGLTVANMFDPTFGVISVLDRFYILLFYLVFFLSGAYQLLIGSAILSFKVIPAGKVLSFSFSSLFGFMIDNANLLFLLAFKLAFPIMLTLFVVNLALALINRLIPQINVFIVGLPLQITVGFVSLIIGLSAIVYAMNSLAQMLISKMMLLIKVLGG